MTKQEALNFFKRRKEMYIHDRVQEAENIAIECIEKQIPRKPIAYDKTWNGLTTYKCPICGGRLGTKSFSIEQEQIGCSRCLSAIDWSEAE